MRYSLLSTLITVFFLTPISSFATDSPPEYEMIVIENIPENLNLSMSVGEIIDAKHSSQLQKNKKRIYDILVTRISPFLNHKKFATGYNLIQLATELPVQSIVSDLMNSQTGSLYPADFMLLILPKAPASKKDIKRLWAAGLYSPKKAAVIDIQERGFQVSKSYDDLINQRISEAIDYAFQKNYTKQTSNQAFFVGALGHIHLEKNNTSIKFQIVGGLPTDQVVPFDQKEKEVHLKSFNSPHTPKINAFTQQMTSQPGVILEIGYSPEYKAPVRAKMSFGSLGLISGTDWLNKDRLKSFESYQLGNQTLAITQFQHSYNVPHLSGELLQPTGVGLIDYWLTRDYDLQMNVHEVELDLTTMELSNIRITMQLNKKDHIWLGTLHTPNIELPSINEKFRAAGNEKLKPIQEELEFIKNQNLVELATDPKSQLNFIQHIQRLLENHTGV